MYCVLCRKEWAKHYPNQNLEVYSANPLLLFPTHYVGDAEWFSDTGESHTSLSLSPPPLSSIHCSNVCPCRAPTRGPGADKEEERA